MARIRICPNWLYCRASGSRCNHCKPHLEEPNCVKTICLNTHKVISCVSFRIRKEEEDEHRQESV